VYRPGRVMERVVEAFRECGYKVELRVVNAGHGFVPQYRERVYFVGSRVDLDFPDMVWENIYPTPVEGHQPVLRDLLSDLLPTHPALVAGGADGSTVGETPVHT